jgi:hypothetical protein
MSQEEKEILRNEINSAMRDLAEKYRGLIELTECPARRIIGTDRCIVTLPCRNDGKHLLILTYPLGDG